MQSRDPLKLMLTARMAAYLREVRCLEMSVRHAFALIAKTAWAKWEVYRALEDVYLLYYA